MVLLSSQASIAANTYGSTADEVNSAALQVVLTDIYQLKLVASEVVCQCALDLIALTPGDVVLHQRLSSQVADEFRHVEMFAKRLESDRPKVDPRFVRAFRSLMRRVARSEGRLLALVAAIELCTSVEVVAMRQLVSTCPIPELLRLGEDEEQHSRLIEDIASILPEQGLSERAAATATAVLAGLIAVALWWPTRYRQYAQLGLDVPLFVNDVIDRTTGRLDRIRVPIPARTLRTLASALLG